MARPKRSSCPISFALDTFGDKWSLLILRDLIFKDKFYYEDFIQSEEQISTNILAERLKRLKDGGLIESKPDKENKRKIIYSPTSKALDLIPMILEMIEWSATYDSRTGAPEEFLKMLKKDRKKLARQVRAKFEK
jgi:DNA-binding HxlR family transcriptional regulator